MKALFKDRSVFFQLLAGGLSIMGAMVLVALIVNTYFLRRAADSVNRRWLATSVEVQVRQLRQLEQDFLIREVFQRKFYDSAQSDALTKFRALVPKITLTVDSLTAIDDNDDDGESAKTKEAFQAYVSTFEKLVQSNYERGRDESGVYGEWKRSVGVLDSIAQRRDMDGYTMQLSRMHTEALYPTQTTDKDIISSIDKVTTELRYRNSEPHFAAALTGVDTNFKRLYALHQQIGTTPDNGLRGQLKNYASNLESAIKEVLDDATRDSQSAQIKLGIATPGVLILGLFLAGFFFYAFAAWISSSAMRLRDAAVEIGRGNLNARVNIGGENELGILAQEFNHMVENLELLVGAVQKSGAQINSSAMELSATAQQQQATAAEIAATTSEVSATAKEISATSQELANNMKYVASVAETTANLAGSGQVGIGRMEATMKQITDASDSISSRLGALSEKAGNITAVVTTITKVADQTNLLSLNAAIEAEKAGEYGRGFAVVATEIRRLADQTAVATSDIERIVKEMQSAVTAGVMGMDKFSEEVRRGVEASGKVGQQLSEIIEQVQTLSPNFEMVNEGMQSQAEGAQQISESLAQLGATAQQTAESLAQSAHSIEQLNEASRHLQQGVAKFSLRD